MYALDDVLRSYRWLAHNSYTELNAFHPAYRVGATEDNKRLRAFPRTAYVQSEQAVVAFVRQYSATHLVCMGVNARPAVLRNARGFARCARDADIALVQNLVLDFDCEDPAACAGVLARVAAYCSDHHLQQPVRAFTGRGYHLLFALPAITVQEHPDVRARCKAFRDTIASNIAHDLRRAGVTLDETSDLKRVVKIYGTAKPDVRILSRFDATARNEDKRLAALLLALNIEQQSAGIALNTDILPQWFPPLLASNGYLQQLWRNEGKPESMDRSRTGFDFSIVRYLLRNGYRNLDDLAAILTARPDGAVQHGKDAQYVKRTIANALLR